MLNIISISLGTPSLDRWKRWQVLQESSYICDHLVRILRSDKNFKEFGRINICWCETRLPGTIVEFGKVIEINLPFSLEYFQMNDLEKRQYLFRYIYDGLKGLCKSRGFSCDTLDAAFLGISPDDEYIVWETRLRCSQYGKKARLIARHYMERIEFYVCINGKGKNTETIISTSKPHLMSYYPYLGKLFFSDEHTICLIGRSGEDLGTINVDSP